MTTNYYYIVVTIGDNEYFINKDMDYTDNFEDVRRFDDKADAVDFIQRRNLACKAAQVIEVMNQVNKRNKGRCGYISIPALYFYAQISRTILATNYSHCRNDICNAAQKKREPTLQITGRTLLKCCNSFDILHPQNIRIVLVLRPITGHGRPR